MPLEMFGEAFQTKHRGVRSRAAGFWERAGVWVDKSTCLVAKQGMCQNPPGFTWSDCVLSFQGKRRVFDRCVETDGSEIAGVEKV